MTEVKSTVTISIWESAVPVFDVMKSQILSMYDNVVVMSNILVIHSARAWWSSDERRWLLLH